MISALVRPRAAQRLLESTSSSHWRHALAPAIRSVPVLCRPALGSPVLSILHRAPAATVASAALNDSAAPAAPANPDPQASPRISRYALERERCSGCGAFFQFDHVDAPGFLTDHRVADYQRKLDLLAFHEAQEKDRAALVAALPKPQSRAEQRKLAQVAKALERETAVVTQLVCQRCHDLTVSNASAVPGPPSISPDQLDLTKVHRALFVQMVDLLDFPATHFDLARIIPRHAPYILAFNKADLLPLSATPARLQQWTAHFVNRLHLPWRPAAVHVISAKSGLGIRNLFDDVQSLRFKYNLRDIYLLGHTNVGKSEFLNCLHRIVRFPKSAGNVTVSRVPGTTVANLPVPLSRFGGLLKVPNTVPVANNNELKGHIMDTPGVSTGHRLTDLLTDPVDLRPPQIVKRLKPLSYRIPVGKSIFLGGLARLDLVAKSSDPRVGITVWVSPLLPVHITSIAKADMFCGLDSLKAPLPQPLVFDLESRAPEETVTVPGTESTADHLGGPNTATFRDEERDGKLSDAQARGPRTRVMPAILSPPSPDSRASLPPWQMAGEWELQGHGIQRAWHDIVFGGLGWISLSGHFESAHFRAYTPSGQGAMVRDSLMPFDFEVPMKTIE
ncbi:hypothetical protein AMAG_00340 [Allomyces macrogynus ATCC 38327]|uniref:G domain-containing protein n=1 Tax=Allomyces macrogynus (strain ATCC 38327) TaxID=578462 RepID=A0A0L0RVL9_ALLM3|nr:hypothetical protein AMAG_00340 [Allomyces macrogynus ATCC 38327]|eukprot:KNE54363.1 hypothetical protein AMAG_00340 [Allomyces macrogynus ATCC 38327]